MIQERQLLLCKTTGCRFRVVHRDESRTYLMPAEKKALGWPDHRNSVELERESEEGLWSVEKEGASVAPSGKSMAYAQSTYETFKDALDDKLALLSTRGRSNLLRILKEANPKIRANTFYKIVRRWLVGGCVVPALAAAWVSNSIKLSTEGVREMDYESAKKSVQDRAERLTKMGYTPPAIKDHKKNGSTRKRAMPERPTRFAVDKSALRVFLFFFKKHGATKGSKLPTRYREMIDDVFSLASATGSLTPWPSWAVPTFRQFEEWYYRMTNFRERRVSRTGEKDWNLNGRSTLQQGISAAYAAGVVASIDATVWAIELVSDDEHARYIGSPIVFRARCRDYAPLLGIAVSLESASWMSAASCIANCNEDKIAFCASRGIHITREQWPIVGLPGSYEADCGETHNAKPNAFISITKTELTNLQAGRGDLKPGVEGDWNVLQVALCDMTPGAIIERYEEMTTRKWRMQARMTLKEFEKMLILEELKKMHTVRPGLRLPVEMTGAGVDTSPLSMWNWSVENRGGGLRAFDHDAVRLSLLTIDKGAVTSDGLLFKGLLYTADELEVTHAYERARASKRRTLNIAYDPRLVDNVYIVVGDPERPTSYVICALNTKRVDQAALAGRTFREVQLLRKQQERQNIDKTGNVAQEVSNWTAQQRAIKENASARVEAARAKSGIAPNALEADRPAARRAEKEATSPSQALRPLVDAAAAAVPASPPTPAATPGRTATILELPQRPKRASGLAARANSLKPESAGPIANQGGTQ
jgi:hypothetical protein